MVNDVYCPSKMLCIYEDEAKQISDNAVIYLSALTWIYANAATRIVVHEICEETWICESAAM